MKIIILAGGLGVRLWPLSRTQYPKQFLKFGGEHSLLQKTLLRFLKAFKPDDFVILTQKEMVDLVKTHVAAISSALVERVVVEPFQRNTAPAVLFALNWLEKRGELSSTFLVAPSDHLISPETLFLKKVLFAKEIAETGYHVTFGISPTHPHTGYGYILCNAEQEVADVERFIEKPSLEKAKRLLTMGNCLWNSGIFVFQTESFQREMKHFQSKMVTDIGEMRYESVNPLSIDYALLEQSKNLKVVPLSLSWSDVGSWDGVSDIFEKDDKQNVHEGEVVSLDTENCLVLGGKRLIATVGIQDLIVVDSEDALLVAKKGSSEKIRSLVQMVQEKAAKRVQEPATVYRPWGSYTVLEEGTGYKIKRICVDPGQKLSLQYHLHRSEHWVVIAGEARVTIGEKQQTLRENESVFVGKKTLHRLENPTKGALEIIEVQVGEYVGEDDIIRLEDIYDRLAKV